MSEAASQTLGDDRRSGQASGAWMPRTIRWVIRLKSTLGLVLYHLAKGECWKFVAPLTDLVCLGMYTREHMDTFHL